MQYLSILLQLLWAFSTQMFKYAIVLIKWYFRYFFRMFETFFYESIKMKRRYKCWFFKRPISGQLQFVSSQIGQLFAVRVNLEKEILPWLMQTINDMFSWCESHIFEWHFFTHRYRCINITSHQMYPCRTWKRSIIIKGLNILDTFKQCTVIDVYWLKSLLYITNKQKKLL